MKLWSRKSRRCPGVSGSRAGQRLGQDRAQPQAERLRWCLRPQPPAPPGLPAGTVCRASELSKPFSVGFPGRVQIHKQTQVCNGFLLFALQLMTLSVISKQSRDRPQGRGPGIVPSRPDQGGLEIWSDGERGLEAGERRAGRPGAQFPVAVAPACADGGLRDTREVAAPLPAPRNLGGFHEGP